ncbi:MAG: hypothetical protein L0Z68_05610 [Gammaproteobacteria bacterium]|nr:hypothetical protein [Gammaproteobacteria bacterium]
MRLIALVALLVSHPAFADEPDNYCNDAESNQQWARLLMKAPDDPMIIRLYALRDGLCNMVDNGQVKLEHAIAIFETARSPAVMDCFKNAAVTGARAPNDLVIDRD